MTILHLAHSADSPPNRIFRSGGGRTAASYEGELTNIRLREALAREDTLCRQMDELTRRQQEVLDTLFAGRKDAANRLHGLTPREREVMELVLVGHPSKNVAADLGISQRTVEKHRAAIMKKMGSNSLPELARVALAAAIVTSVAASANPRVAGSINYTRGGKS